MNPGLRYLNLSGNKRLEIKAKQSNRGTSQDGKSQDGRGSSVANFDSMQYLRVLGLMDVTMGFNDAPPTNTEDRRVRTQEADVNGMTYGIADTIGKAESLSMFDLVAGSFRGRKHETLFMMFGRAQQPGSNSKLAKFLHDNFVPTFRAQLNQCDMSQEGIKHSLRRTFLKLNKTTFEFLRGRYSDRKMSAASVSTSISLRKDDLPAGGASGIVAYVVDKVMYVANVGNALAVVSRGGHAISVSRKHDPWDREETSRIRSAEGWVSVTGQTNDEIDVSRSFGFYRLTPMVNCKPDVHVHELEETDDFLIIANRGLWDYVSFQTAVDISRVNNNKDPMLAAQKLRDIAISYGADGGIMIMVIYLKGIFKPAEEFDSKKSRGSLADIDQLFNKKPLRPTPNKVFPRMDEVPPPTKGLITLVFTDIRNSTVLWEKHNGGMSSAIRTHNDLLRFWLRLCRGYEVKTEGDAFMCSFHTPMDAIWWTLRVQIELLGADWPRELLDTDECREIHDVEGKLIARGVSVRMGIHCGNPGCEPDPVTGRMDYFGPMVNRTARVNGQAAGGQIAISGDVLPELKACLELAPQTENTPDQPADAVAAVRALSPMIFSKGHFALKGIEQPEYITHIYPRELASRETIDIAAPPSLARVSTSTRPRIQFKPEQIRALGLVAVRLEAIAAQCVHKTSLMPNLLDPESLPAPGAYQTKDIELLIPILSSKATDQEVISVLDSLTGRINNATAAIMLANVHGAQELMQAVVTQGGVPDDKLQQIMAILNG
jgi:adenylate cyclase